MKKTILIIGTVLMMVACDKTGENTTTKDSKDTTKDTGKKSEFKVDFGKLNQVPNPIEIAEMIKSAGVTYDKSILNSPDNVKKYNADHQKALNLGVYSTDLGYANIYGKGQDAINFLDATRQTAEGLKISQYFDFEKIKKLTAEPNNIDDLMQETLSGLQKMNEGLEGEKRGEIVALIVVGGWVEAVQLACHVAKKSDKNEIKEKIADQKSILAQLLNMLENNKGTSKHIEELYNDLKKVEDAYKNISIEYSDGETQQGEDGKVTQKNVKTTMKFTKEDLEKLTKAIDEVRKKIVAG
jgi:hypothetical protein